MVSITLMYALLLTVVGLVLQFMVSARRGALNVSLESGGDRGLTEAIRRHANWTETVPVALLLMLLIELNGAPKAWLHGAGGLLFVARTLHPLGIDQTTLMKPIRFVGMGGTIVATLALCGIGIWQLSAT